MALKKIFLYGINYAPELLGVGRFSGELGDYLARSGTRVEVIASPPHYPSWSVRPPYSAMGYKRETIGEVRITRCPIWLGKSMRGFARLLAPTIFAVFSAPVALWRIWRTRPDLVLVTEPTLFVAPAALLAARLCGARVVLHVQDLEVDAAFAVGHLHGDRWLKAALWVERQLLRRFDAVITISQPMLARLRNKGVPSERLAVVRNWVDLEQITPRDGPSIFRDELGVAPGTFVALYAGSVGAKQGLHVMLDAAERLHADPGILFVIAGHGPAKDALVSRYGQLPNVRFLPMQPESRLCELLSLADLHVLPQARDAADLVLPSKLGAMLASGRDILVTADAGTELHDFLSGTAAIVPAGDSEGLAREVTGHALSRRAPDRAKLRGLAADFDSRRSLPRFAALLSQVAAGEGLHDRDGAGD